MLDMSIFFIYRILQYVKRRGVSPEILLEKAGVDLHGAHRFDSNIPQWYYFSVMETAVTLTGDNYLGLHVGEATEWMDLSNLGYIMASCRDLGEALHRAVGYIDFIGAPVELRLVRAANRARLLLSPGQAFNSDPRQCVDELASSLHAIFKKITGKHVAPSEVGFAYPAPEDCREYERIFSCPVLFDQPVSSLVFHSRELLTSLIRPNPKLLFMARHGGGCWEEMDDERGYSKKTAMLLYARLDEGPPCIKDVAKELGVSIRGLQMKLSEEGETFSRIVRDVRRELAKTYLADKAYSIDEITFLLGFSEPSVFHRAFKTWTGLTPGEYRSLRLTAEQLAGKAAGMSTAG